MSEVYWEGESLRVSEQRERRTSDGRQESQPRPSADGQAPSTWGFLWGSQKEDMSYLHKADHTSGSSCQDNTALPETSGRISPGSNRAALTGTGTDQRINAFQDDEIYVSDQGSPKPDVPQQPADSQSQKGDSAQPALLEPRPEGPRGGVQISQMADSYLPPDRSSLALGSSSSAQNLAEAPPMRASESLSNRSRHALRRARTSMETVKEGMRSAGSRMASTGERVGRVWNRTLNSALLLSVLFGVLAIVLLACALPSRKWRQQLITYQDSNGFNWSRVDLGLQRVQRVQKLKREADAGLVWMYDRPVTYAELAHSAYCLPDNTKGQALEEEAAAAAAAAAEPDAADPAAEAEADAEEPAARAEAGDDAPAGGGAAAAKPPAAAEDAAAAEAEGQQFLGRRLQAARPAAAAAAAPAAAEPEPEDDIKAKRFGPLSEPPEYRVTFGRDPAVPGALESDLHGMRLLLLGPTVYDVHCGDLPTFKRGGAAFVRFCIAFFIFAGLGLLAGLLALLRAPPAAAPAGPGGAAAAAAAAAQQQRDRKQTPLYLLGSAAWLVALVLQAVGLASWGVSTDLAACVTTEGGAAVCPLGSAAATAIVSLAMTLIAALFYTVFFTHKCLKDLGLPAEAPKTRVWVGAPAAAAAEQREPTGGSNGQEGGALDAALLPPSAPAKQQRLSSSHAAPPPSEMEGAPAAADAAGPPPDPAAAADTAAAAAGPMRLLSRAGSSSDASRV